MKKKKTFHLFVVEGIYHLLCPHIDISGIYSFYAICLSVSPFICPQKTLALAITIEC